jgi:alpha-glucosidase
MKKDQKEPKSKWWQKGVIYQIYPRSFKDENNDGIGDLRGIISKLDYLNWLGVSNIWLSPHYPSPMEDFGYDITDYCNVDPIFGTLSDFDELIEEVHKRDMRIIIDFVPNHTSDKHSWFIESKSSEKNPKHDWYIWRSPKGDGNPPNNWICITGGSAWRWNEKIGKYYLHSFLPCQPDLNWNNQELRKALMNVLRFWLERGVDGFRIDMISWISKDHYFRDDPINPRFNPKIDYGFQRLDHKFSKDGPHLYKYLQEIRNVVDEYKGEKVLIGEADYYLPVKTLNEYYQNGIDLPANFRLIYLPWEVEAIKSFIVEYEEFSRSHANYQIGNHDHKRVSSRIGIEQSRLAAMLLLTLRGTPFIYYGDEIGMQDVSIPIEKMQDPWEKTEPGKGRDPQRSPMQWNSNLFAGFSLVEPWLPVSMNYKEVNIDSEQIDPHSVLNLYRNLISLRTNNFALSIGTLKFMNNTSSDFLIYSREYYNDHFIIALNFSEKGQDIILTNVSGYEIVLSTYMDRTEYVTSNKVDLRKYEGCILSIR